MYRIKTIATGVALALGLMVGSTSLAGEQPGNNVYYASEMMDLEVKNTNGDTVGTIADAVLQKDGTAEYVIVRHGGLLGVGSEYLAIPTEAVEMTITERNGERSIDVQVPKLKKQDPNTPVLKKTDYSELGDNEWRQRIAKFFGTEAPGEEQKRDDYLLCSNVVGSTLYGNENTDLGTIDDVAFKRQEGKACFLMVDQTASFTDEMLTPLPMDRIRVRQRNGNVRLMARLLPKDLENAKRIDVQNRSQLVSDQFLEEVENALPQTNDRNRKRSDKKSQQNKS